MEYIISEEELKELIPGYSEYPYQKLSKEYKEYVEDFLKSKQPVKEVYTITPSERLSFSRFKYTKYKIYIQKEKQ